MFFQLTLSYVKSNSTYSFGQYVLSESFRNKPRYATIRAKLLNSEKNNSHPQEGYYYEKYVPPYQKLSETFGGIGDTAILWRDTTFFVSERQFTLVFSRKKATKVCYIVSLSIVQPKNDDNTTSMNHI